MSDLNTDNKAIKFPKAHYIGYIGRPDEDDVPLAFMTEDGTDKAAEKRKETVRSWVGYNSHSHDGEKRIKIVRSYENKPLVGFRLGRSIRRYSSWGSGNVKWRIEDPRGFELEISSPNMAQIAAACVLQNGEILDECVWARLKGDNVLVPVSSELYQAVLRNDQRMATKVKPSDVQRGDHVVLQNGNEGIYLGKFESFDRNYRYDDTMHRMFEYQWKAKPVHAMILETTNHKGEPHRYLTTFSTFKPSYVTKREGGPLTPEEAEKMSWDISKDSYRAERLYLSKPEITYLETPLASLDDYFVGKPKKGRLLCKQGDQYYSVGIHEHSWKQYQSEKIAAANSAAVAPTAPVMPGFRPLNFHNGYGVDRHTAQVSKVTKADDGHYLIASRNRYGNYNIKIAELEKLPLVLLTAWIPTTEGKKRYLD